MKIGLYPGTFDPMTHGHYDIIRRGLGLVDKLVIGVSTNPSKTPMFTLEERVNMIKAETGALSRDYGVPIVIEPFDELLVHFAARVGAKTIIRGLRAVADFEYEFQMTGMNYKINPDIDTVFLMADPKYQAIASRLVKEVAFYGGDISSFVSQNVRNAILEKVKK